MFENILPASIPSGMQGRVMQNAPSNEGTTSAIVIPQMGMHNGSVPSTISVAQLLAGVKDRERQAFN